MFNAKRKILTAISLISLVLIVFGFGIWVGAESSECKACKPENIDFSLFWQAYGKLKEKFVDKGKIDDQKIIYGAIAGMVNSLDDPYTVFMEPQTAKKFSDDVKGSFEGVGLEVGIKKGQLQVIAPLEGTPAQKAGLRSGDFIVKINSTSTADITVDEAVSWIRGPKGTEIILTAYRKAWDTPKEIKIIRDKIEVPSLKWELKAASGGAPIAYIKLYQFSEKAGDDFTRAANEILRSGAKKIILDMRDNPGGYLRISQDIAGWFFERGQTVTIEDFGQTQKAQNIYRAEGNAKFLDYPVVVLVNQGAASASEILAGALRDNRQVLLIGEKTFGKGSVQEMESLPGDSSLKITIARWLTPSGKLIAEIGLEPDIKVVISEDDLVDGKDPQLEKALEVIREMK